MNNYWKTGIALASILAAFVAGWTVNGYRMQSKIDQIERTHAEETAESLRRIQQVNAGLLDRIKQSAEGYQALEEKNAKETAKLKQELKDAKAKKPLPADCRLDAHRLRIIQQAVSTANQRTTP
ncbi:MAG: hypothetical protein IK089_00890 [Oxalobacter sp.]|nr:hypothetical protein [Oxalobacter sp.]